MHDEEMTDEALDREIERAMTVDPSPAFVARIRRRVAAESVSRAWTLSSVSWIAVASSAAVAAVIAYVIGWNSKLVAPSMPTLLSHTIPVADVPGATVSVGASGTLLFDGSHVVARTRARSERLATSKGNAEPEILVDPREARAIRSLLDDVVSGRIDLTPLLDGSIPPVMDAGLVRDIYIAPIELSPLTEKGVLQ
jgi:hypothetical protein